MATKNPYQLLDSGASTSGQVLVSQGAGQPPTFRTFDVADVVNAASTLGKLNQFQVTSSAELAGVMSDETGSGKLVFGTAPTLAQPIIQGIVDTSDAAAGVVGQYASNSVAPGAAVALVTNTATNIVSLSLTAGDWDVWGTAWTAPGGTTNQALTIVGLNTTSSTLPTPPAGGAMVQLPFSASAGQAIGVSVGTLRVRVAIATNVFLVLLSQFSISTNSAYGFIGARRRR
ncbi:MULTISPECIES: hypothetical protein [unclassified Achromobacter]|uniref:hypothetical protein n=1 Tax=unclassified Achromobacter TaxID=2626865 RepID=UPI000B51A6F6|nr:MULTISPECIES: hypothetical protein [unclassified Achromobacter]OWT68096.1 hypothetical protein CEY05_29115 [Achromobacter sp. HZ34]OWT69933.1 hypothetical protein CEY04_27945 [Achromobacter sp. HZ28]